MTPAVRDRPRLVVITGGPGAGKTAALEVARRELCVHVEILPEAAGLLWRGGFPRRPDDVARRAAQRAIVHVQIELQTIALARNPGVVLCDRGTLDGLAYWPGDEASYFTELATTRARELARYATVIHLRPPDESHGYRSDEWRPETAVEAAAIDRAIERAWADHPHRVVIESRPNVLDKLAATLAAIARELPACCRVSVREQP